MRRTVYLFLALLLGAPALAQSTTETLELGRSMTEAFYEGELTAVHDAMTAEMSTAIGGEEGLEAFRQQLTDQLGEEVELLDETVTEQQGGQVYTRTARFARYGGPVYIEWSFGTDGEVLGFMVQPGDANQEAESAYLDYSTKTDLRLPFDGEWTVYWGGRSIEQNYHAAYGDQRFAYDFVVTQAGDTHAGEGQENEDYYCYGLPILAPGDGVVVDMESSLPDNVPGQLDDQNPLGNHVIIDHGNGEFSFLAHLRQDSVVVQADQQVSAGEPVGECGNSGRSSEPHLHYHLQDSAELGAGAGLPAQFQNYFSDGDLVERGEPEQGQSIEAEPSGP